MFNEYFCACVDLFRKERITNIVIFSQGSLVHLAKKTDDPQGRCCVFPFEYGGVTYQSCTNGWCSFDEVYVGNWAIFG